MYLTRDGAARLASHYEAAAGRAFFRGDLDTAFRFQRRAISLRRIVRHCDERARRGA